MLVSFLIFLSKMITFLVKLIGRDGTIFAGSIIKRFDKNILSKIKYPKYVIGVTGSSGKGTTISIINDVLTKEGHKVIWNSSGSNVSNAIITLVLNNSSIFKHSLNGDVLLLELDESYIRESFKKSTLTHLIITNITRDQPARNGEPEIIYEKIMSSIKEDTHIIINGDDPILNKIKYFYKNKVTSFGIDDNKYSIKTPISNNLDASYCPVCNSKLTYDYYHYGHIGKYSCSNKKCKFKRELDYVGYDVNLEEGYFHIQKDKINLNQKLFYYTYAILGAYALLKELNIDNVAKNINNLAGSKKRLKYFELDNRKIHLLDTKNENNLSYYQTLQYINSFEENKTIVLGFENVSRRYKHNDISLLYDIDYEVLNINCINKIFIIGRFKYNIMTRLNLAGIEENKLHLVKDLTKLKNEIIKNSSGEIFVIADFEMTNILKNIFEGE